MRRHLGGLRDVKTGTRISRLQHNASVYYAAFCPDGRWVATTSEDLTARVWDAATGLPVTPPLTHANNVLGIAFSPDGRSLATGCFDGTAHIWDLDSSKTYSRWSTPGQLQDLSPDTRYALALSDSNHTVHVLDSRSGRKIYGPWHPPASVRYAAFSLDSRLVITTCADKTARLWNMALGKECRPPLKHDNDVLMATVSPDARRAATGCKDGTVHVWDLTSGKEIHPPLRHAGPLHAIQFSNDGRRLLTASMDSTVRVWDAATGQPIGPLLAHGILELGIWRVNAGGPAWSPDGNRLATRKWSFQVRIWDAATGHAVGSPLDHNGGVASLTFSPDGSCLLSTSNDGTAVQWDVTTGKRLTPAMRHSSFVDYGTYSPDGRRIATTDHTAAWMWDAATGLPLAPPSKAGDGKLVRFSPEGRHLFRYDVRQPGMNIWDVSPDDRPVEDLVKLTNLLAGHQLDANGGLIPLTRDELRKLWQDLEAKYPDGFDAPVQRNELIAWHLQQAEKARSANRHPLVLSHWVRAWSWAQRPRCL